MAGRGKWSTERIVSLFKTEEIIIYTNRKGPGKFDSGGEEENYWDGIIRWMRLNRSSAQVIGLRYGYKESVHSKVEKTEYWAQM